MDEYGYDTDKDPEYQPGTVTVNVDMTQGKSPINNNFILNSPSGKFTVENNYNLLNGPSYSQTKSVAISSLSQPTVLNSPTTIPGKTFKRCLFMSEPSQTYNKGASLASTSDSENIMSKAKEQKSLMLSIDFQNFVVNSLIKLKFDVAQLITTTTATNLTLENMHNISEQLQNSSSNMTQTLNEPCLNDIFPINSLEELNQLEIQLETDKQFRSKSISKLSLLVGTKNVGDSVRHIMMKIFNDEISYSLQGFKKKKSFQNLSVYHLLIDAIRVHPKFRTLINKEFDITLATWLAHANFGMHNKK